MLGILALAILVSFVACDFFTTSWGTGLQRDLGSLLEKESPDDLAKLASDQNYKGDSKAAAALLNALSSKPEKEIQSFSSEEKNDILNLALTATLPMDAITDLVDIMDDDDINPQEVFDSLIGNVSTFDTKVVQTILNNPEGVDSESLVSASVAVVAQVFKREEGLDMEFVIGLFQNTNGDGSINFGTSDNINDQSKDDLEAVFNVFNLLKNDEEALFFGMSLDDLFGGH